MKRFGYLAALLCVSLLAGCGDQQYVQEFKEIGPPEPLTVDAWKQLPPAEKFDPYTFERLRAGDPKLNDPKAWREFEANVIAKEMKAQGN